MKKRKRKNYKKRGNMHMLGKYEYDGTSTTSSDNDFWGKPSLYERQIENIMELKVTIFKFILMTCGAIVTFNLGIMIMDEPFLRQHDYVLNLPLSAFTLYLIWAYRKQDKKQALFETLDKL